MFCIHQNSNYYEPSRCVLTTPKWANTPPRCSVRKRYSECASSTPEPVCFLCTKVARFPAPSNRRPASRHQWRHSGDIVANTACPKPTGDQRQANRMQGAGCRVQDARERGTCDRDKPRGSERAGPQAATASLLPASRDQRPETSVLVTIKHNAES